MNKKYYVLVAALVVYVALNQSSVNMASNAVEGLALGLQKIAAEKPVKAEEQQLKEKYSWMFSMLPEKYHTTLIDVINGKHQFLKIPEDYTDYLNAGGTNESLNSIRSTNHKITLGDTEFDLYNMRLQLGIKLLKIISQVEGIKSEGMPIVQPMTYFGGKASEENSLWRGQRTSIILNKEFIEKNAKIDHYQKVCLQTECSEDTIKAWREYLTGLYKIHITPQDQDILKAVSIILQEAKRDMELQDLIYAFKVYMPLWSGDLQSSEIIHEEQVKHYLPPIVIYSAWGQHKAEKLLNKLIALFNRKGNTIRESGNLPRYNVPAEKSKNIVFYAQGDGDSKQDSTLNVITFYDPRTNYALYRPDFTSITPQNYKSPQFTKAYAGNEKNPYELKV